MQTQAKQIDIMLNEARRRAAAGVAWFDRQARTDPRFRGWRLEMMSIHGGQVSSHVHFDRSTQDPLSLVLKRYPEFADPLDGRVKLRFVLDRLVMSFEEAKDLGFYEGAVFTPDGADSLKRTLTVQSRNLWVPRLNHAWEEALGEYSVTISPDVGWKSTAENPHMGFFGRILSGLLSGWMKETFPGRLR